MTPKSTVDILNDPVLQYLRFDYTAIKESQTVGDVLTTLRTQQLGEKIVYIYVLSEDGQLIGVLPTRRLLMSRPEQPVAEIMLRRVITVSNTATVFDACEFFIQYRFLAFPVVDSKQRMLGVVDVGLFTDEVFDVAEQQSVNDVFQLIGVHVSRHQQFSPVTSFRDRFPWLLCNIAGGLACAFLASRYEAVLDQVIVLALFVPIVLALAESVSIQSTTIMLQTFHDAPVNWSVLGRALGREFAVAVLLGLACGLVVGGVAWMWKGEALVANVLGLSICLSMITACLLGVLLPTTVRACRADPRIAAGPIVLASADLATLLFYFNVATVLLT